MLVLLVLLFIVVPIAEIYVIIQVGQAIGVLWTILLLIADSIIGARLLSWQGRRAWLRPLVVGFEAPIYVSWARNNRSGAIEGRPVSA